MGRITADYLAPEGIDPKLSTFIPKSRNSRPNPAELTFSSSAMLLPFNRRVRNPTLKRTKSRPRDGDNLLLLAFHDSRGQTADNSLDSSPTRPPFASFLAKDQLPTSKSRVKWPRRFRTKLYWQRRPQTEDRDYVEGRRASPIIETKGSARVSSPRWAPDAPQRRARVSAIKMKQVTQKQPPISFRTILTRSRKKVMAHFVHGSKPKKKKKKATDPGTTETKSRSGFSTRHLIPIRPGLRKTKGKYRGQAKSGMSTAKTQTRGMCSCADRTHPALSRPRTFEKKRPAKCSKICAKHGRAKQWPRGGKRFCVCLHTKLGKGP